VAIQATKIFDRNRISTSPVVINRGGGGSSKSYSVAQLLVARAYNYKNTKILILRKTRASLRKSVCFLLDQEILPLFSEYTNIKVVPNKTDLIYIFSNGSIICLDGVDDPQKLKSTQWNYIWFEEATDFTIDDFRTVRMYNRASPIAKGKINQIFLTFNPVDEFSWIKEKLIDSSIEYEEIHSTFKDNRFLPKQSQEDYKRLIAEDENYYRVYSLGEWGRLEGLIYTKWSTVNRIPDNIDETIYGIDFGFNNPSAIVKITISDQEPYVEEKLYKSGLTNLQLMEEMLTLGIGQHDLVYADCAEPARIKEMSEPWRDSEGNEHPGFNIKESIKTVKDGIDCVKRYKLHVLTNSDNIIKELRAYKWRKDRNGHTLDEPVKFLDHLMDAIRYALYTHFIENTDIERNDLIASGQRVTSSQEW
jgi:phage terminase large subunit